MRTNDLAGRSILVTGANTGIGRETAIALGARGARLWLAGRSEEKTRPVVEDIRSGGGRADFLALDLADLAHVRETAASFLRRNEPLHVLVANAGVGTVKGLTAQGFDMAFGVNHLGHYLFTRLLLPRLRACKPARIVVVASHAHYRCRALDFDAVRTPTTLVNMGPRYALSKLANVLFVRALASGHAGEGVHSYAVHPGGVASDVWRGVPWPVRPLIKSFLKTTAEGARSSIHCAASTEVADHDGRYYDDACREKHPSRVARDPELARTLWDRSSEWVADFLGERHDP